MKHKYVICLLSIMVFSVPVVRAQFPLSPNLGVTVADLVVDEAMKYLGTPYRWAGKTPKGFDCAGFTRYIYGKFGLTLPPAAGPQYKVGKVVDDKDICKGDLVFYGGRGSSKLIGHVGIVTSVDANGFKFIHSATSTGITISSSNEAYYKKRYIGACRVVHLVDTTLPANEKDVKEESAKVPVYRSGDLW